MSGHRYALFCALALGCKSRPHTLIPPPGCTHPSVIACLQPLAYETLSASALVRLQEQGQSCFSKDKATLRSQASCLPLIMGSDAQGRGKVEMRYYCADLCPEQGGVVAQINGPRDIEACCVAGGDPLLNGATHRFRACMIPSSSSPSKLCRSRD